MNMEFAAWVFVGTVCVTALFGLVVAWLVLP
jgi:hypothetical protein